MPTQPVQRFYSLDVFRGTTVAFMILVNNPGSWSYIYDPLEHAAWHGCTPTDLVFPFFLFAVGNAMAFVLPQLKEKPASEFWRKILQRTLLIMGIGLLLNWFPFVEYNEAANLVIKPLSSLRFMGVLQRIALCYFFAAIIIYYAKDKGAWILSTIVLLLYWLLCIWLNPADPFSLPGWFGTAVDKAILGENHLYRGEGVAFDPEGIASTATAIVQVIFGYLAGRYIIQKGKTADMLNGLFVAGCALIFTGICWDLVFPINKKIWTSSYTVYSTGLALLVLAFMIYWIEFKNKSGYWASFFNVFGKNPLFVYMMSAVIPGLLALWYIPTGLNEQGKPMYTTPLNWWYESVCKGIFSNPAAASLFYAISFVGCMWLIAWCLHRKKIYIKV